MFNELFTIGTLLFILFSLINVILQTLKSILTVKASKHVAAIINAVTFGFYTIVLKQLGGVSIGLAVISSVITNLIGVYIACFILEKTKKDKLWIFNVLACVETEKVCTILDEKNIEYEFFMGFHNDVFYSNFKVFSYTQKDTIIIMDLLKEQDSKYYITEAIQVGGK